jgi:hypothetical protein
MIFFLFSSFLLFSLLFFVNTIYFVIVLLCVVVLSIFFLVQNIFIQPLIGLILVIVYIGAIIILIGYICAVCPNIIIKPKFSFSFLYPFLLFSLFIMFAFFTFVQESSSTFSLLDFYYSFNGFTFLFLIILILFLSLLIVTSQYYSPKGPFRSTS